MYRKYSYILICMLALVMAGCKDKPRQQHMLSEIEHYDLDTVKAKQVDIAPVTRADSCRCRADVVLRKYPEMYHATDDMQKNYKKWVEEETKYLTIVFVGKDKQHNRDYKKLSKKFTARMEELNFIEPLAAIMTDEDNSKFLAEVNTKLPLDEKAYTELYRKVMFSVKDGLKNNKNGYSTDEMRTACEKSRRAWIQYMNGTHELLKTMPAESVPLMEKAMQRIKLLHYIDLVNFYMPYWSKIPAGYILKDNANDQQITSCKSDALHYCSWMEVNDN